MYGGHITRRSDDHIANCLKTHKTINRVKTAYLFNGTPFKYIHVGLKRNIHVAYALINRHPLLS